MGQPALLNSFTIQSGVKLRPQSKFEVLVFYNMSECDVSRTRIKGSFP